MTPERILETFSQSIEKYIRDALNSGEMCISRKEIDRELEGCPKGIHTTVIQLALSKFKTNWGLEINRDNFRFWR
jgi:hypothetical protein